MPSKNVPGKSSPLKSNEPKPVIKSPLDTHGYKIVRSPENGLKGLLVSTCLHPRETVGSHQLTDCTFRDVLEFNKQYIGLTGRTFEDPPKTREAPQPVKKKKRNKNPNSTKTKCRRGIHEKDDDMQTFCNNFCIAVLYVKAGFVHDPPDLQGMAHFCEHCLFLGSRNYSETEQFTKFVEANEGSTNAITGHEYTQYVFHIYHDQFDPALDMFADMFANPLFNRRAIAKEIDNVNSEFEIKRLLDEFRQLGILQSCIKEDHPAHTFGMGSKQTLRAKGIGDRLKEWYEENYFAGNMLLALQGPRTLPQLEDLFNKFTEKMPVILGKQSSVPIYLGQIDPKKDVPLSPFDKKKWNQMYFMDSSGSTSSLSITWPLFPKFGKNFSTKPIYFYTYVFTNKGEGTLDWYLKQKGWITSLSVNNPDTTLYYTEYFSMINLILQLTEDGLQKRMNVLYSILKYITILEENLLQDAKASKRIFTETQQLQADIFHYRSDMNLSDPTFGRRFDDGQVVSDVLSTLLHVMTKTAKSEEVLLSAFLVRKFDLAMLQQFIKLMTPSRALVIFASKHFEEEAQSSDFEEKFYKTKYFTQPLPEDFTDPKLFRKLPEIPELSIPKPNQYIGVDRCFPHEKLEKREGLLAYETEKGILTYGNSNCQKGLLPSAQYTIDFLSYALEDHLANQAPLLDILVSFVKYMVDVKFASALSSLMSYDVENLVGGLRISVSGPSPILPDMTESVFKVIENLGAHATNYPQVFEILKRNQAENYKMSMEIADICAEYLLDYLLSQNSYFLSDFMKIAEDELDHKDFILFAEDFISSMYIDADLEGCVSKRQSVQISGFIENLQYRPYKRKPIPEAVDKTIQLPLGDRCLRVSARIPEDKNVVILNYYQVKCLDRETRKMLNAIDIHLGATVMEELRTKRSLGYQTFTYLKKMNGIYGVTVTVQGVADKHTCGYIDEQIDNFLVDTFENCFSTSAQFRKTLLPLLIDQGCTSRYPQTKNFFMTYLHPRGDQFRKLSIQIQGHKSARTSPLQPTQVEEKMKKYSSGVKLKRCPNGIVHCGISQNSYYLDILWRNVTEENGYFITNVQQFKNDQNCLGNLESLNLSEDEDDGSV